MKPSLFKYASAVFTIAALTSCSDGDSSLSEAITKADYRFSLDEVVLDNGSIKLKVSTDLPLPVDIMAGVSLADQKPEDIYIGISKKRIIEQANSVLILNISDVPDPLPDGDYLAEINFYPVWGAMNPKSRSAPELHDSKPVSLEGSSVTVAAASRLNDLQKWVYLEVDVNTPWDEVAMIKKLGKYEKAQADLSPMHDALYFPDADITMIVNRRSGELSLWRDGRLSK